MISLGKFGKCDSRVDLKTVAPTKNATIAFYKSTTSRDSTILASTFYTQRILTTSSSIHFPAENLPNLALAQISAEMRLRLKFGRATRPWRGKSQLLLILTPTHISCPDLMVPQEVTDSEAMAGICLSSNLAPSMSLFGLTVYGIGSGQIGGLPLVSEGILLPTNKRILSKIMSTLESVLTRKRIME
jgi:hypothetical protein